MATPTPIPGGGVDAPAQGDLRPEGRAFLPVGAAHSAAKLRFGDLPRTIASGNMPSSSSAMAIAPVGIVNAGHPRAAAAQAMELASLIHVTDVAFCQDGAAAIAAATSPRHSVAPSRSMAR